MFTHCLTFIVLATLVASAVFVDARLQPRAARADLAQKITSQADPKDFSKNTEEAPVAESVSSAEEPQPDPDLPPPLSQSTDGLNSELIRRFDAFRTFIFQKHRVVLEIRSGYRSAEEQAHLFRTLPPGQANPPGKSNHEKGEAIDYTNYSAEYNQHLAMFGLKAPFAGKEDWHIERVEVSPYN